MDRNFWGLGVDQSSTTHPIAADVVHTGVAEDIFDGISYGKGASLMKQMWHLWGRNMFKQGLKTYFEEFSFKNTTLDDFYRHMSLAQKTCNVKI